MGNEAIICNSKNKKQGEETKFVDQDKEALLCGYACVLQTMSKIWLMTVVALIK